MTMNEHLVGFITYLIAEKNASPYTVRNYQREIEEFAEFAQGEGVTSWEAVDLPLLRRWLAWLTLRQALPVVCPNCAAFTAICTGRGW